MFEKYHDQIESHLGFLIGSSKAPRLLTELSQDDNFHVNLRLVALTINSIISRHHYLHNELFQACPDVDSDTDLRLLMLNLFDLIDNLVNIDSLMRNKSFFSRFITTPFSLIDLHIKKGAINSLRSIWTK